MTVGRSYDVVIVGAGPAGLGAARTTARLGFRTLVLERLTRPGELRHPCNGILTPVPGFVTGRRLFDGLFLPSLDLLIPSALIAGYPPGQRFVSPSGHEFQAAFKSTDGFPAAVVDKPGLLALLARQAQSAGAELSYGRAVTGLVHDETGAVCGVQVGSDTYHAQVVLSGEGAARQLCDAAGLPAPASANRWITLINQDMIAPEVGPEHVGQVLTVGQRYTSAQQAYGMVVVPAPGRASVFFTLYNEGPQPTADPFLWFYMDEYVHTDPRVRYMLEGAQVLGRARHKIALREAPRRVVADGFIGIGDAITPAGHLGILPALYLGRQAALTAAESLDSGGPTIENLATYDLLLHESILPNLEAEAKIMMGLTRMPDGDLDRLCLTLGTMQPITPIFSNWRTLTWEMVGWMIRQFPMLVHDWRMLQGLTQGVGGDSELAPLV